MDVIPFPRLHCQLKVDHGELAVNRMRLLCWSRSAIRESACRGTTFAMFAVPAMNVAMQVILETFNVSATHVAFLAGVSLYASSRGLQQN